MDKHTAGCQSYLLVVDLIFCRGQLNYLPCSIGLGTSLQNRARFNRPHYCLGYRNLLRQDVTLPA